jgi:hypothetical protein
VSVTDRLQCDVPADWANDFSQCLFEWQGLEGGALALAAALIGSIFLWKQIQQSEKHRLIDLTRRHNAAKLTLPLALSFVSELCQSIATEIASELETYGPNGFDRTLDAILGDRAGRRRFDPVELPGSVIGGFEKFVETLSNPNDIKHVSELIASIQILCARYNGQDLQGAGARTNLESLLLDAATVKTLCDSMFNYARSVDHSSFGIVGVIASEEAWRRIQGSAQSLVFSRESPDFFFPAIQSLVSRYSEAGTSPWLEKFPG